VTDAAVSRETTSAEVFGDRLDLARRFADILRTDAITRGLIGPREGERVWERHVLNCAAVAPALPVRASVLDVGSGAGLPGLVLAIARPDTAVTLLEPLQRRVDFLEDTIAALGLSVTVVRARAEELATHLPAARAGGGVRRPAAGSRQASRRGGDRRARDGRAGDGGASDAQVGVGPAAADRKDAAPVGPADIVTARAVAPLSRLVEWCLPLVRPGGALLAVKGDRAAAELRAAEGHLGRLGASSWALEDYLIDGLQPPTRVVRVTAAPAQR